MTAPEGLPPVAEWLRGKATMHRRAAATYARTGEARAAELHRRVAVELGDLAVEADAYTAGMGAP